MITKKRTSGLCDLFSFLAASAAACPYQARAREMSINAITIIQQDASLAAMLEIDAGAGVLIPEG
jgi:hypothetical protein